MGRRDVMESITNAAFGVLTSSVILTTPMSHHDVAFAAIPTAATATNDAMILMDGTASIGTSTSTATVSSSPALGWMTPPSTLSSSPTTLYMAQQTPKQLIAGARTFIQNYWSTYISNDQWATLTSSYNTQNSVIRSNANTIVNQNPGNQLLVTRRAAMFTQLDSTKLAIDQQDKLLATARTQTLVTRIQEFLNVAP
jgi:hypothetical protein